ncbi:MAG TPA: hypothetical protein VMP08_11210 [Anaerolineae bacterium]|nr:hypothetical protein [Anaerolineae bacterium]
MEEQSGASAGMPKKPRRTGLIVGGVIALIVLLGGAAFVGGRLLNNQAAPAPGPDGLMIKGGPGGAQGVSVQIEPAKELPAAKADALGLFAERKDNSIFVTIGSKFMVQVDKNGNVNTQTDGNGDKLEIVVTGDTTIYKDVTEASLNNPPSNGTVQQQLAPGSLDEIGTNSFVSAWGEKRGDRVIAKVLMYSQPMMIKKP